MLNIANINSCQNINCKGFPRQNAQVNLVHSIDAFKDRMLEAERDVTGYITPEVRIAIADKINNLKLKVQNINPQKGAALIKPLQDAVDSKYDITEAYLALGDFEKNLSKI